MGVHCLTDSARKLRAAVALVCFGIVLLWVVFGNYADDAGRRSAALESDSSAGWRPYIHSRHLLAVHSLCDSNDSSRTGGLDQYDPATADCEEMHNLPPNVSKCDFVRCVDNCQEEEGLLNYLQFVYCTMPPHLIPLSMVILFMWMIVLFVLLGTTAEDYFCPSLKVISSILHLSQNVAGVTLLALGNGAPDIFSAYAAIDQSDDRDASLAIGALFGAGLFVTTILIGAVAMVKPVHLAQLPFMRDIVFYLAAAYWTFCLLWNGGINIWNASGLVAFYAVYVMIVITGHLVHQRITALRDRKTGDTSSGASQATPTACGGGAQAQTIATSFIASHSSSSPQSYNIKPSQIYVRDSGGSSTEDSAFKDCVSSVSGLDLSEDEGNKTIGDNHNRKELLESSMTEDVSPEAKSRRAQKPEPSARSMTSPHCQRFDILQSPEPYQESPKVRGRTVTSALDLTEEIGAAIGIPHVPEIWEEIQRSHSRHGRDTPQTTLHPNNGERVEPHYGAVESTETTTLLRMKTFKQPHPFVKMLLGIWPFGHSFKDLGYIGKTREVIKAPFTILLALTVPVVDFDEEDHNWNRWLNVFHVVSGPVFIALITKQGLVMIGGVFPVVLIVLSITVIVAILVACTSRNDKAPRYHCVFAWLAFAVAVVWIYSIANEIVNVLDAFGLTVKLSNGILGLTLLAWGNSVGDAVANITMARQGFPKMALAACFGGPLLNTLLGVGIASVVKSIRRKGDGLQFQVYVSQVEFLSFVFLVASLLSSLLVIAVLKMRLRWTYGLYLLILYFITIVTLVVAEFNVFHIGGITMSDNY